MLLLTRLRSAMAHAHQTSASQPHACFPHLALPGPLGRRPLDLAVKATARDIHPDPRPRVRSALGGLEMAFSWIGESRRVTRFPAVPARFSLFDGMSSIMPVGLDRK